jgi:singapore isolate B (sub-type 7) whole genome shotgun sequence assembly, scaffold_11
MGERKVVNKFIPWDFDPDKVAKVKLSNIGQFSVRMMLPFTVRCNSCGEFMYAGKKFNTRKENANGEDYLGIPIQRFYFKCVNCGAEFAIKTDPKNSTYVVESGATRNSNIQLNERQQEMEDQRKREEAESMDAIKALENRTEEMKREMDIYDSLDLVLAQTRKTMNTDPEAAIDILRQRDEKKKKKEEEAAKVELENKDKEEMEEFLRAKKEEEIASKEDLFVNAFAKRKELPKPSQKRDAPTPGGVKVVMKKKKKVVIPMKWLVCCHS